MKEEGRREEKRGKRRKRTNRKKNESDREKCQQQGKQIEMIDGGGRIRGRGE